MLTVGRITLFLPAGLDHRAAEITDGITRHLAALHLPASREIGHIVVNDLTAAPGLTPEAIAAHVASAVQEHLALGDHGGSPGLAASASPNTNPARKRGDNAKAGPSGESTARGRAGPA